MVNPQSDPILNKYTLSVTTIFKADVYFISCMSTTARLLSRRVMHYFAGNIHFDFSNCKFSVVISREQMKQHGQ